MTPEERYNLITRNLQEIIGDGELKEKLKSKNEFTVYWGTAITGSISIAYFFPMLKIADFLKASCKVKILLADFHGALDNTPWDELEKKYNYYKEAITQILKTLNVPTTKLEFVKGSKFQLDKKYFEDLLKMSTYASVHDSKKAGSEVVKQTNNPKLSGLIYPLMQSLDEEYLKADAQLGGNDQRKIMVFAREILPKIGYKERIELLNPLIRGLTGEKMSSSNESSKIDLMDDEKIVIRKINNAEFISGNASNGVMALLKYFIFITKQDKGEELTLERSEKFGGNLKYEKYDSLEKDFLEGKLHPLDIKNATAKEINNLLIEIRSNNKLKKYYEEAYKNRK